MILVLMVEERELHHDVVEVCRGLYVGHDGPKSRSEDDHGAGA